MEYIKTDIVDQWHDALINDKGKVDYLLARRGINIKTIKQYKLGFDAKSGRYCIPVFDSLGNCVNIRKWIDNKGDKTIPKLVSYAQGYGESRLYPVENLSRNNRKIVICEGEWDCLLLNQNGVNAVTNTTGAGTWMEEWNSAFNGFDIVIIFDCDDTGRKAAANVKAHLLSKAKSMKVIDLGLKDKEDVTDWFVKYKKDMPELSRLVRESKFEDIYELVDLSTSMESRYYGQHIKFNGLVIGKDLSPYLIPLRVMMKCKTGPRDDSKYCAFCPLQKQSTITREYDFDKSKELLIKFIGCSDKQMKGYIRQDMNLPPSTACPGGYTLEILDRQNVENIQVIPQIDFEMINREYVIRQCYYFGINCKANTDYLMKGTTWSNPDTQMGLHLIQDIEGSRDTISKFSLTDEIKEKLKIFRPEKPDNAVSILVKLAEIYKDLTINVTKMYQREMVIMATDLVFHSVLNFKFLDRIETKGWLECAVIGDTKCGKTETIKNIVKHYRAGEFLTSGENTTLAGILGGVQQIYNRFIVTWGKLPLNDRRLVIVDEADNLAELGILGKLSGVRSSGIAEIVKVQPQKTMARTRIIWIANPIHGRMNEKNYGIEVIRDVFGKQQDISRLDFAIAVAREDIDDKVINIKHSEKVEHKYTTEHCHLGVMFAWSRGIDNIIWAKGTEQLILDEANRLGEKYSPSIPLVIGAEMRIKIARMAIALACRMNSVDESGENVIVYPAHVEVVVKEMLEVQYDSDVMGYRDYSEQRRREVTIGNTGTIDSLLKDNEDLINELLDMDKFQMADIEDVLNIPKGERKEIIQYLRQNKIIKKVHTFYMKTTAFIVYLKNKRDEIKKKETDKPASQDTVSKVFLEE